MRRPPGAERRERQGDRARQRRQSEITAGSGLPEFRFEAARASGVRIQDHECLGRKCEEEETSGATPGAALR